MGRIARVVAAGYPHHVTQRGNRRQATFFGEDDYRAYLALLAEWTGRTDLRVWAYCLLPNHVHLIVVPGSEAGLARTEKGTGYFSGSCQAGWRRVPAPGK